MNRPHVQCISTNQGKAYVIDSSISEETLQWIDNFRCSLTLNSKRPTVDRRFFADGLETTLLGKQDDLTALSSSTSHLDSERPMASLLERAIERSICSTYKSDGCWDHQEPDISRRLLLQRCHVFRYQRFLEYTKLGSQLDPHTDGNKVCDDTQLTSTHTLLLYLTDCPEGGETLLLTKCAKEATQKIESLERDPTVVDHNDAHDSILVYATIPKRGRILIFPHSTPHAGAKVVSLPKICLRAEVALLISKGEDIRVEGL
jgi:2OG-Fe(II) oxygenase superfamily